ncbi:MAG: NHL repeat-containing protein [Planctomycetota bacterium]
MSSPTLRALSIVVLATVPLLVIFAWQSFKRNHAKPSPTPAGKQRLAFGKFGEADEDFQGPFGVSLGPEGDLYIADDLAHKIVVYSQDGGFKRRLGERGSIPGAVAWPDAVALNSAGHLLIADTGNNRIQTWTLTGEFLNEFGQPAIAGGDGLKNPRDVAVDQAGRIYVANFNGNSVDIFDAEGRLLRQIKQLVPASGESKAEDVFLNPIQLAIAGGRTLFVVDNRLHEVVELDLDGNLIRRFGKRGNGAGELEFPHGIAIGPEGNIHVADYGNHRIQIWSKEGQFLRGLGHEGSGPGELREPTDLCFLADGLLAIVDKGNHRIVVWQVNEDATSMRRD